MAEGGRGASQDGSKRMVSSPLIGRASQGKRPEPWKVPGNGTIRLTREPSAAKPMLQGGRCCKAGPDGLYGVPNYADPPDAVCSCSASGGRARPRRLRALDHVPNALALPLAAGPP